MGHPLTKRFIICHGILKETGRIRTNSEFAQALDYSPQGISEILNGRRDVTIDLMTKAVKIYKINPIFLTLGKGPEFLNEKNPAGLQILSVVVDENDNERIVHVPVGAQAGYALELADPEYLSELPMYNIPDYDLAHGSFRSFDVEGASMYPTLLSGDRVICQYVEPSLWAHYIKGNHVYVLVSENGVVVKRVKNNILRDNKLVIISDNETYSSYEMDIDDVKEVWQVKVLLRKFDHFKGAVPSTGEPSSRDLMDKIQGLEKVISDFIADKDAGKNS